MRTRSIPTGNKNTVGARIQDLRKSRHLSQQALLARIQLTGLDMGQSTLSKIEGQQRSVSSEELFAIAEALEISLDELRPITQRMKAM